ncbi:hypothetical protein [Carboxydothermus hydrogenoformans]|uniref:Uncharacterized protein n=1 Tax=Carboxydothermus hydrogenoformans (strain ATCC BAA-161 / DSM 6008 / Z-2901) TaxID=246194 RepID=Q3AAA6_CARHZ|nr:hypothetical protein [Carboxydothermus hydrogenoformans]ABB15003.1 hypothetical protein CHY_2111 [Carboxydothermus hydrogenoformans Z-2901]
MLKWFHLPGKLWVLLILGVFLFFGSPVKAYAQSNIQFKDFTISVLPEYDEPDNILVIYEGTIISSEPYNGEIRFMVPRKDENIKVGMACEINEAGGHECQPFRIIDKGDYQELVWKISKIIQPGKEYKVYLEFYYYGIEGQKNKTINYRFIPVLPIQNLTINVGQPLKATNFKLNPPSNFTGQGYNLNTFGYTFSNPNKPISIKISYTKEDPNPSFEKPKDDSQTANTQAPPATSSAQANSTSSTDWVILLLVILFIVFLGVVIFYAFKTQSSSHHVRKGKGNSRSDAPAHLVAEKKRIRKLLLEGKISEETYRELINDLENEYR